MHLSWGKASNEVKRKELWDYATTNGLIGIDCNNPDVNVRWAEFSRGQRAVMSAHWRRHFDLFSAMQIGDCVVVANGVTELLGIGVVKGSYEFNGKLGAFFRHVRRVDWILQHQWGNRLRLPIHYWFQGFQNTIQRIDNNIRRRPLSASKGYRSETSVEDKIRVTRRRTNPQEAQRVGSRESGEDWSPTRRGKPSRI